MTFSGVLQYLQLQQQNLFVQVVVAAAAVAVVLFVVAAAAVVVLDGPESECGEALGDSRNLYQFAIGLHPLLSQNCRSITACIRVTVWHIYANNLDFLKCKIRDSESRNLRLRSDYLSLKGLRAGHGNCILSLR